MLRRDEPIETESRLRFPRGGCRERVKRKWGVNTNGYGVSFRGDENVLILTVMMVAQIYVKNH